MATAAGPRFRRSARAVGAGFAEEAVVLQLDRALYHGLDRVGARVWELLDVERSVEELLAALAAELDMPEPARARDELLAFLGEMEREGLVERAD